MVSAPRADVYMSRSALRQEFCYQAIVFPDEWIDKHDVLQHEAILKIFGQQVPDSGALRRRP